MMVTRSLFLAVLLLSKGRSCRENNARRGSKMSEEEKERQRMDRKSIEVKGKEMEGNREN